MFRIPALATIALVSLGMPTKFCGTAIAPPDAPTWLQIETTESFYDSLNGSFYSTVSILVSVNHRQDLPNPAGWIYAAEGQTNWQGVLRINNARLPAIWQFATIQGPCQGRWPDQTLNSRTAAVELNCEVRVAPYSLDSTQFDEVGDPVSITCCNSDVLTTDQQLGLNERITSSDGRFKLVYQGDGNLVLYRQDWTPIWWSGTQGPDYRNALMQSDGNFVLYHSDGTPYWSSGTVGNSDAWLMVQNDGNVVIYSASGSPLWATNTCCQ
jgi:hypothetical protein